MTLINSDQLKKRFKEKVNEYDYFINKGRIEAIIDEIEKEIEQPNQAINIPLDAKQTIATEGKVSLYSLKLHETLYADMKFGIRTDITRVPGGWIYQSINRNNTGKDDYLNPIFIPFNNEFQKC